MVNRKVGADVPRQEHTLSSCGYLFTVVKRIFHGRISQRRAALYKS